MLPDPLIFSEINALVLFGEKYRLGSFPLVCPT